VARDLSQSARTFLDVVWPAIRGLVGYGEILPVEGTASAEMQKHFDQLAGIDAWQVAPEKGRMRGIASRVQYGDRPWETFTIRYARKNGFETEYAKRLAAILDEDRGWILPHLTVQAYVTRGTPTLLLAAVTKTQDLYLSTAAEIAEKGLRTRGPGVWVKTNPEDGTEFLCVSFDVLRDRGMVVKVRPSSAGVGGGRGVEKCQPVHRRGADGRREGP